MEKNKDIENHYEKVLVNNNSVERRLPELKEVMEEDFLKILEERELTMLENEISLLDMKSLGMNLNELDENKIMYVFNYLDEEVINPYTNKKTKNDMLNSFVMSFDNHDSISRKIWDVKVENKGSLEKPDYVEVVKVKDFFLYRRWKLRATKYWNENKLSDYVFNMKTLLEGQLDRGEVLKEAIFNDSISTDKSEKIVLESRKQMIDILGLRKPTKTNEFNIFHQGGGRELVDSIKDMSNMTFDADFEDLDYIGDNKDKSDVNYND